MTKSLLDAADEVVKAWREAAQADAPFFDDDQPSRITPRLAKAMAVLASTVKDERAQPALDAAHLKKIGDIIEKSNRRSRR